MTARGRQVQVIGHRGASHDRPENTLEAFEEALAQGADGIELDVQLSRDGVPIVWHDRTLARAGLRGRRVSSLEADRIMALPATVLDDGPAAPHIPTLERTLERFAHRTRLLIEIKSRAGPGREPRRRELVTAVAALVRGARAERHVQILSFDIDVLVDCSEIAPQLARILDIDPPPQFPRRLAERLSLLNGIAADVRGLRPAFSAAVQAAQLPLWIWTCNTSRTVSRALAQGAHGILSDRPAWLRSEIERQSATP